MCLTLPFWSPLLPSTAVAIVAVRNPLEIAQSLARRDRMPSTSRSHCGSARCTTCCRRSPDGRWHKVGYTDLLADPLAEAERLRAFLSAHGVQGGTPRWEEIREFVTAELRSQVSAPGDLARAVEMNPARLELAEILSALPATSPSFEVPSLPAETARNDSLFLGMQAPRARRSTAASPAPVMPERAQEREAGVSSKAAEREGDARAAAADGNRGCRGRCRSDNAVHHREKGGGDPEVPARWMNRRRLCRLADGVRTG